MSKSDKITCCDNCGTKNRNTLVCMKCDELLANNCLANDFSTPCSSASELIRLHNLCEKNIITEKKFYHLTKKVFSNIKNKLL